MRILQLVAALSVGRSIKAVVFLEHRTCDGNLHCTFPVQMMEVSYCSRASAGHALCIPFWKLAHPGTVKVGTSPGGRLMNVFTTRTACM